LHTARAITENRIITVFGCGGDRDRTKRPIMGRIVAQLSDIVITTSDNPRTEDPEAILAEIEAGVAEVIGKKTHEKVTDRREAIYLAISLAQAGDTVIIAGKGHEDYQIIGTEKIHFDDREVAREALGGLS
ncbi:MAG: UDP-N-acetylmuramoyl-L-alanyl-D-glutamate--2,6-diaminopimelate ligase, partial [Schwartzia sp.]|nr:UDP-N-acetylmuramoyl-L-alanyl-D-glutamate--2,6-diaminopimelate ligase [Schwartzia sp. (in: firmicutes)]